MNPLRLQTVKRIQKKRSTSNHFTSVVYNALVVLVRSMGEVHTNYVMDESDHKNRTCRRVDVGIERTDIDTGPSKLSKLLGSVDLRS